MEEIINGLLRLHGITSTLYSGSVNGAFSEVLDVASGVVSLASSVTKSYGAPAGFTW